MLVIRTSIICAPQIRSIILLLQAKAKIQDSPSNLSSCCSVGMSLLHANFGVLDYRADSCPRIRNALRETEGKCHTTLCSIPSSWAPSFAWPILACTVLNIVLFQPCEPTHAQCRQALDSYPVATFPFFHGRPGADTLTMPVLPAERP